VVFEVEQSEEDYNPEDMEKYKSMCLYVRDYGCGDQQKTIFEKPSGSMKGHHKPLFVQAKVDDIEINKVLVESGDAVNLMHQSLLKKIGKCGTELKPNNICLSNYEGKAGILLGAPQVNLILGSITRPTLFVVVPPKANFNLLLGREWIHGIGVVPSYMHQRVLILEDDGTVENVEAGQSYFLPEVNNIIRKTFEKSLDKIAPCSFSEKGCNDQIDVRVPFSYLNCLYLNCLLSQLWG